MHFDRVLVIFFISFATLAGTHRIGLSESWYFFYPWFDMVMHFSGGCIIALGSQTVLFRKLFPIRIETIYATLGLVLGVGLLWEVFEWWFVLTDMSEYVSDTIIDLILDLVGGYTGYKIGSSFKSRI